MYSSPKHQLLFSDILTCNSFPLTFEQWCTLQFVFLMENLYVCSTSASAIYNPCIVHAARNSSAVEDLQYAELCQVLYYYE